MTIEIINATNKFLTDIYEIVSSSMPEKYRIFINIGFYTLLIAIYAIFVWKFYRFLAKRDILELNLGKYNTSEHPVWNKFWASLLFFIEYIIILPFVIFFWFAVLALFLLLLSKSQSVSQILLITAGIVGAVRLAAYYKEDLSKDLAKMFPFTILVIFLLDPDFFSLSELLVRFSEIPRLIQHIFLYLIFIAILEIFMRFLFTIIDFFRSDEKKEGY